MGANEKRKQGNMKIINGELQKLTEAEAFREFDDNFKEDFYDEWWSLSHKDYQKEFYYWCSLYDDTKHLTKNKEKQK